jgi:hypothetical protein
MSPAPPVWRPGRASTFSQVEKAASPIEILAVKSHQILPSLLSRRMMFHFSLKKSIKISVEYFLGKAEFDDRYIYRFRTGVLTLTILDFRL